MQAVFDEIVKASGMPCKSLKVWFDEVLNVTSPKSRSNEMVVDPIHNVENDQRLDGVEAIDAVGPINDAEDDRMLSDVVHILSSFLGGGMLIYISGA